MGRSPRQGGYPILKHFVASDLLLAGAVLAAFFVVVAMLPEKPTREVLHGVGRAIDGDTLLLGGLRIHLLGLDAPELRQTCERAGQSWNCGAAARSALAMHLGRGAMTCASHGLDRYGRTLAVCSVQGQEINSALVREGIAVAYGGYEREQREASDARRGIWAGQLMLPQEWRRLHRESINGDK